MPRQKSPLEILKRYWGHDAFRPLQEEIINSVVQGLDTLALLPTGGGKSVCYQVPAMLMEGMCLVVSPLIALMKDQVQQLRERGIKAACLVSGMTSYEQSVVLNNCLYGKVKLLYVSPERLKQRVFIEHLRRMKVSMIAVDEAHCISQWGYDFRPPYLEIAAIRQYHPMVPVLALTATATPEVADDICRQLQFRTDSQRFQSSFRRENLAYMVFREEDKMGRLLRIARTTGGAGIVYVRNRRRTKEVADYLAAQGVPAMYYHAGMSPKERDAAQTRWMQGSSVMVATNAFGMGIDKPDVRFVVHLDIPSSPEAYFQEAGRAGRDGKKSYAVLLYDDMDLTDLQRNFESAYPSLQQIGNVYRAICNYYQLPLGAGCDCQFDFDIEALCRTYQFNVTEFYHATRFLEREGMLSLPDREAAESRLYVPLSMEELYRFQVENRRYGELMTLILRMYGGVFSEFVPISERAIARRALLDEATVERMLMQMDALKVLAYKRKSLRPQIVFTSPRIDAKDLYLSDVNYKDQKERAQARLEAMRRYIAPAEEGDNGCRSQRLLAYFGEHQEVRCGECDLCLQQRKEDVKELRARVLELLAQRPMRADELAGVMLAPEGEETLTALLRRMMDEGTLTLDGLTLELRLR